MSAVIREALGSGTVRDQHVVGYTGADPGHRHDYSVTGYQLQDGSHRIVGAAGMIHDVSVSMKNRQGLELLSTARARIGNTLDSLRTAQELAEVVFPEFADAVAVDLLESVLTGDAPLSPVRSSLPMRRAAFRAREGQYGAYPVGAASYYAFPTPYTQTLADLRPRLVDPVTKAGAWLAHDPARAEYIARAGIHSLIVAPLTVHGLVMGLVSFYRDHSRPDPFDEDDLALATQLASRTALCIDNARRFTREHTIATTLELSLLPHAPPTTSAVDSSHCYFPGRYGAHWFEVIPLACARVALVVGFVPGEGLEASATMGQLRSAAATLAGLELPPTNCSFTSTTWSSGWRTNAAAPRGVCTRPRRRSPPTACTRRMIRCPGAAPSPQQGRTVRCSPIPMEPSPSSGSPEGRPWVTGPRTR